MGKFNKREQNHNRGLLKYDHSIPHKFRYLQILPLLSSEGGAAPSPEIEKAYGPWAVLIVQVRSQ